MTTYYHLRFERPAQHVARVVINRPQVANALSHDFFVELDDALDRIESDDDIRVWVLTGAPRPDGRPCFSSGADMKAALAAGDTPAIDRAGVVNRIDDQLVPSIAAIDGICTTGALEVALACDIRVAGTTASISDRHMSLSGLGIGAWGAAARLSRLIGVDKAKELLLLSSEIDGMEAHRIGLVHAVVDSTELEATSLDMARTIARMPPRGVRTTLAYLQLQAEMDKYEAIRLADRMPSVAGLRLRPFGDAASRYFAARGRDRPDGDMDHTQSQTVRPIE